MGKKLAAFLLVAGLIATTAYANGNFQPGSADDPIVTKSYVDEQLAIAKNALLEELKKELQKMPAGEGAKVIVEKLTPGQKIIGMEGTEFIVRSGKAVVIAGSQGDGIPDLTSGANLAGGAQIPLNHHLLIPRSDNRGLQIVQGGGDGYSYVVIRGAYTVQPAR